MGTVVYVTLAALLLVALAVGGLFGTVWFAGKANRRTQTRH